MCCAMDTVSSEPTSVEDEVTSGLQKESQPLFSNVLLLIPITLVPSMQASDVTLPKKLRDQAVAWLEGMMPQHAALAVLCADRLGFGVPYFNTFLLKGTLMK